jgi:hypothetical protein
MEKFQQFMEFMRPHWSGLALLGTWLCIAIVAIRRRMAWRSKRFLTRVNFSLNYCLGKQLAMRTLTEKGAVEVWPNEYGVRKVFTAAARATVAHPFIALKNPKDQDFVNRAVLNVLSERFADTYVAAALGVPITTGTFCFALTFEKYQEMRTLKLRVLIVEERTLQSLFGPAGEAKKLEVRNPVYKTRLTTLEAMYAVYCQDKDSPNPVLGRIELGVVAPGSGETGGNGPAEVCATSASRRA